MGNKASSTKKRTFDITSGDKDDHKRLPSAGVHVMHKISGSNGFLSFGGRRYSKKFNNSASNHLASQSAVIPSTFIHNCYDLMCKQSTVFIDNDNRNNNNTNLNLNRRNTLNNDFIVQPHLEEFDNGHMQVIEHILIHQYGLLNQEIIIKEIILFLYDKYSIKFGLRYSYSFSKYIVPETYSFYRNNWKHIDICDKWLKTFRYKSLQPDWIPDIDLAPSTPRMASSPRLPSSPRKSKTKPRKKQSYRNRARSNFNANAKDGHIPFNIVLAGKSGVGKTTIKQQFDAAVNKNNDIYKYELFNNKSNESYTVRINLHDPCSGMDIDKIEKALLRAQCLGLIFDITDKPSLKSITKLIARLPRMIKFYQPNYNHINDMPPFSLILIGNMINKKEDYTKLIENNVISPVEIVTISKLLQIPYFELSINNDIDMRTMFKYIIYETYFQIQCYNGISLDKILGNCRERV